MQLTFSFCNLDLIPGDFREAHPVLQRVTYKKKNNIAKQSKRKAHRSNAFSTEIPRKRMHVTF